MTQEFNAAQPTGRRLKWNLLRPFVGSSSPSYVQLDWRKLSPDNFTDSMQFQAFYSDPKAGLFPRGWQRVGLLAIDSEELKNAKNDYPDHTEAVACVGPRGKVIAGQLPDGVQFGKQPGFESISLVAMRIGPGALRATMGLWLPGENFVEPGGETRHGSVHARGAHELAVFHRNYPDVPVV